MSETRLKSRLDVTATVVMCVAAVTMVFLAVRRDSQDSQSEFRVSTQRLSPGEDAIRRTDAATLVRWEAAGRRLGPANARIRIVEFANFMCDFCAQLHTDLKALRSKYPDQISVTWLHYTRDAAGVARKFSLASECAAEQGKFEAFHDSVFAAHVRLGTDSELRRIASHVGVPDSLAFETCLRSEKFAPVVDEQTREATMLEFPGTPVWFLNGRGIVGAAPREEIEAMIVAELRPVK